MNNLLITKKGLVVLKVITQGGFHFSFPEKKYLVVSDGEGSLSILEIASRISRTV